MKVLIIFVLSAVCLSSARYVKWSPNDIEGHRDFKEEFHQFWSQLGDLLAEQDEQDVKDFLHQTFQIHRPSHDDSTDGNNFNHDMVKPNRPFTYHHVPRPSYNDRENMMRPLHHEDFVQQSDEEISRPVPPKPLRPLPNRPVQTDDEKYIMRPLNDLPVEIDEEFEISLPQKHIMRPVRPADVDETMDNVMRPFPQKPLRPLPNRPVQTDDEKYIMRPLNDLPVEIDEEFEISLPQHHIMRPVRPADVDETMDNVMRPFPQKPLPNRPVQIDDEKYIMRPLTDLPVEIHEELEISLPQKHIMRPVRPADVDEAMDNVMRPFTQKPVRPLPNRPDQIEDEKYIMRPLHVVEESMDMAR